MDTLIEVKGKFMLTMFPHPMLEQVAGEQGWHIHRIERRISAAKDTLLMQEEPQFRKVSIQVMRKAPITVFGVEPSSLSSIISSR